MSKFRPMLAGKATAKALDKHMQETPLMAFPKLDGLRGVVRGSKLLSRSLKPIRNTYTQAKFGTDSLCGFDGELIVGSPTATDVYRRSSSAIMRIAGEPDVTFYVFDACAEGMVGLPYLERYEALVAGVMPNGAEVLPFEWVHTMAELEAHEEHTLSLGFEGVILRRPDTPYKYNRSTPAEGGLLKLKRFTDAEATIIAVEELMHNANEAVASELGLTKRSSHKDNKVPMGMMGALVVRDIETGAEFRIGTGFTDAQREVIWRRKDALVGLTIKYKFFHVGVKDLPRHPVYLGFRDPEDMGNDGYIDPAKWGWPPEGES